MKIRKRVPLIILALGLACMPGFGQTEDAAKVQAQAEAGVVAVIFYGPDRAEIAKSSGIVVAQDLVATAYDMAAQAADAEVMNAREKKFKVEGVVGVDKAHNIAILRVKGKFQPLTPGSFDALAEGERIFALGSNEAGSIIISEGTVRRVRELEAGFKTADFSLTVPEQFRGGPLLNLAGQVVGMVQVLDRRTRFGVPFPLVQAVSTSQKPTALKDLPKEKYYETFEGAWLAGRMAFLLGEASAARPYLERAVKLNPSFTAGWLILAQIYSSQRDLSGSAEAYRRVIEAEPERAEAHYGLGRVLMAMMKNPEAAASFEKAASLGLGVKELYIDLAVAYENTQEWEKAAGAYEKFISLKPESTWSALLRLGICRSKLGQYDLAAAALAEAMKEQPNDLQVNLNLADVYEKSGRLEEAEGVYNRLAEIDKARAKNYYMQVVKIYDTAGQSEKAVAAARRIVELEPGNQDNHYNLGLQYFKLQKYPEAIQAFQKALEINPEFSYAWFQTASSYFNQAKYKEAAAAYTKYAEQRPDDPAGWLSIGVCHMYLKDYESALEPLKKCIELKPDNASALYNLAICYINLHSEFSARDIYKKLQTLDPALAQKLSKYLK